MKFRQRLSDKSQKFQKSSQECSRSAVAGFFTPLSQEHLAGPAAAAQGCRRAGDRCRRRRKHTKRSMSLLLDPVVYDTNAFVGLLLS
mmetsp:Transcript_15971/g.43506  ORF Transcript_15971/g.43506 Transcript_15971/m.43506 type:complete len:87 (+) Transcript_15971:274-534(+)